MTSLLNRLSTIAAVLFVVGPGLAHFGLLPPLGGFVTFALGGLLALIAFVRGLIGLARGKGADGGLILAGALGLIFVVAAAPGRKVPRINDITTDTQNPPQFAHAQSLPANQGRDMSYPGTSFAEQQLAGYGPLEGHHLNMAPDEAFQRVVTATKALTGAEVTQTDAARRTLEGVATSKLFRFQDDFVVEVRPAGDGSIVQMRSKSRDGKGDFGVNAARIRALFEHLG